MYLHVIILLSSATGCSQRIINSHHTIKSSPRHMKWFTKSAIDFCNENSATGVHQPWMGLTPISNHQSKIIDVHIQNTEEEISILSWLQNSLQNRWREQSYAVHIYVLYIFRRPLLLFLTELVRETEATTRRDLTAELKLCGKRKKKRKQKTLV